jgi:hypothetical protein
VLLLHDAELKLYICRAIFQIGGLNPKRLGYALLIQGTNHMAEETDNWSMVAEFTNHPEADLIKNLLEKHGIRVAIWSDDCGGLAVGQTFIQRVRLFVPDSDRQAAMDILGKWSADA